MDIQKKGEELQQYFDQLAKDKRRLERISKTRDFTMQEQHAYYDISEKISFFIERYKIFIKPRKNSLGKFSVEEFVSWHRSSPPVNNGDFESNPEKILFGAKNNQRAEGLESARMNNHYSCSNQGDGAFQDPHAKMIFPPNHRDDQSAGNFMRKNSVRKESASYASVSDGFFNSENPHRLVGNMCNMQSDSSSMVCEEKELTNHKQNNSLKELSALLNVDSKPKNAFNDLNPQHFNEVSSTSGTNMFNKPQRGVSGAKEQNKDRTSHSSTRYDTPSPTFQYLDTLYSNLKASKKTGNKVIKKEVKIDYEEDLIAHLNKTLSNQPREASPSYAKVGKEMSGASNEQKWLQMQKEEQYGSHNLQKNKYYDEMGEKHMGYDVKAASRMHEDLHTMIPRQYYGNNGAAHEQRGLYKHKHIPFAGQNHDYKSPFEYSEFNMPVQQRTGNDFCHPSSQPKRPEMMPHNGPGQSTNFMHERNGAEKRPHHYYASGEHSASALSKKHFLEEPICKKQKFSGAHFQNQFNGFFGEGQPKTVQERPVNPHLSMDLEYVSHLKTIKRYSLAEFIAKIGNGRKPTQEWLDYLYTHLDATLHEIIGAVCEYAVQHKNSGFTLENFKAVTQRFLAKQKKS
ncbi:hypothetical protein ENBRE01_1376 [Enteropsectra breve]|nr:hypothetical protein ENBRE01_1376 [Enteropsectra breve]